MAWSVAASGGWEVIEAVRTERSFGVTGQLTPEQRRDLAGIRASDAWPSLLDVMEMCCIEIETKLLNTDAADSDAVLANHKMAKAAWLIFTHLQEKVDSEISLYMASIAKQPPIPPMTYEEQETENILDPTRPLPEEGWSN
jgi:hypothetical protein